MKPHNEFIEDVKEASSLPAQTNKALGPESDEDEAMYNESNHSPITSGETAESISDNVMSSAESPGDDLNKDAVYTTDETEGKK